MCIVAGGRSFTINCNCEVNLVAKSENKYSVNIFGSLKSIRNLKLCLFSFIAISIPTLQDCFINFIICVKYKIQCLEFSKS